MDLQARIAPPTEMSDECHPIFPDESTSSEIAILPRSSTSLSDTPTLRIDTSETVTHKPPRIAIETTMDMSRSASSSSTFDQISGIISVPDQFDERMTRRMAWIMQTSMDSLLPSLQPEQRQLIEGTTDLRQLIVPLFQSWEIFRSANGQRKQNRITVKSTYDNLKTQYTNNEVFERFWAKKQVVEKDDASWGWFKNVVNIALDQITAIDRIVSGVNMCNVVAPAQAVLAVVYLFLKAAQKTYDAFEMIATVFEKLYLFVLRLHESLSANLITSTMLETYALVVVDVFKIVLCATRYAKLGNKFYWKAMFDPQDELYKLIGRFNEFPVQEIASQVSQISLKLEKQHRETNTAIEGVSREVGLLRQETLETSRFVRRTSDLLERMAADVSPAWIRTFHKEIGILRKWLRVPPNTEDDFTKFKGQKMRGTCEWIFDDPRFQTWKTSSKIASALLWIHARAGRGKSVLAATIIQRLLHETKHTADSCVYFFCRSDDESRKTPHAILRSTAFWLAQRNDIIRQRLMEFYGNYPELRIEELPLASLWDRLFMQCICVRLPSNVAPFKIYWVIDALDECDSTSRPAFTNMLAELGEEHCGVSFRLLFLSRYVSDIAKVASTSMIPTIDMKISDNDHDIQQFITIKIGTSPLGSLSDAERHLLISTLRERANGSFLWIKFVMEDLEGRRSMRSIEEALNEIPANKSLEDIYQLSLNSLANSCNKEDLFVAREIFMWTLCAPRPLSLEELTAALEASMETHMMDVERAVKETCGSLIEVVHIHFQKRVMAAHITLREFMLSEKATGPFAFSKATAHKRIARTCLNYLLQPQFSTPFTAEIDGKMNAVEVNAKHPLLNYASRYWSHHLVSDVERFDPDMNALVLKFLQSRNILTSIEAMATFGNLSALIRISNNFYTWLKCFPSTTEPRQSVSVLPVEPSHEKQLNIVLERWALDLRRIKQRFQYSLLRYPRAIHDSVPSFCPTNSMIFKLGAPYAEISIANPSSQSSEWDNLISMFPIPGFVRTMVCNPQRPLIASAVDSPEITVWDAETGQPIRPLSGHNDLVYVIAFSKDGSRLVSGGKDEDIIVWNVERGHEVFRMKGHSGAVYALAYSYSGKQIASGGEDSTVRIWDVSEDSGRQKYTLSGHVGIVYTLKYHSDNIRVCSSAEDGLVIVWNAPRGSLLKKFNTNLKWLGRLSFHPSWDNLIISSEKTPNNVDIWNVETGEIIETIVTPSPVRCWKYSLCAKYIVTGHLDGRIRIWDSCTFELIHTIVEDAWSIRFSNGGKYLICLIRYISRWQVRTWDFDKEMNDVSERRRCGCLCTQKPAQSHRVVQALAVNLDNSRLATVTVPHAGTWNGKVKLWNPATATILWEQDQIFRNHECISPGFSPDGRFLVCYDSGQGGGISILDAIEAKVIEQIPLCPSINLASIAISVGAGCLAISTRETDHFGDGETSMDSRFFLTREFIQGRKPFDVVKTWGTQNSMTLSYTADGSRLLLGVRDRHDNLSIAIWDTESQQLVHRVTHDRERYIWFKMFGEFRLCSGDRIIIHVDYMPRDAARRSLWREKMLVLGSCGEKVESFEAGSSRMTIAENRVIFLDSLFWIVSWDGQGSLKRHVKLPVDVGFAVSGLSFSQGKLTLVSRTEQIMVVEIESLK